MWHAHVIIKTLSGSFTRQGKAKKAKAKKLSRLFIQNQPESWQWLFVESARSLNSCKPSGDGLVDIVGIYGHISFANIT